MERYGFFDSVNGDRRYSSDDWDDYFRPLFKTGVFTGDLRVTAGPGMAITIAPGYAWMDGKTYHSDSDHVINLATASGNLNRYDGVVIRLDRTARVIGARVKTGNQETYPSKPTVTRNATAFEIMLADIYVKAGTTTITQSMITDHRLDAEVCGLVTGTVEQIDYAQIFAQFTAYFSEQQSAFDGWMSNEKTAFLTWAQGMIDDLDGDALGNILMRLARLEGIASEGDIDAILDGTYTNTDASSPFFNENYFSDVATGNDIDEIIGESHEP